MAPAEDENRNKAAYKRFHDTIGSGDAALISKTIDELFEPDVQIRMPIQAAGTQAIKELFGRLRQGLPDLHITVEDLIADRDKVVGRNSVTGTHLGEYLGLPPTGKSVAYNEMIMFRFAGDRIAETWGVIDVLSQMRQLDAIPGGS